MMAILDAGVEVNVLDSALRASGLDNESVVAPVRIEPCGKGLRGYARDGSLCLAYTCLNADSDISRNLLDGNVQALPMNGVSLGLLLKSGEWSVRVFK